MNQIKVVNTNGKGQTYPVQIPDLYKIGALLRENGVTWGDGTDAGEQVINTWHLAHDLMACITGGGMAHLVGITREDDENEEPTKYVRIIMGHMLMQCLHWANCADINEGYANQRNDLNHRASRDTYQHLAAALTSLGFNRAREVYSSEGDIESAHNEINDGRAAA
ncbi:MAG: hypothetical protein GY815_07270 [Gammaproteobacteria bacterium]|nr:hypothetical protein [Gammaproteobacteria bacterium]